MKLLHVSDWHLGRSLYGVSRAPDHDAVLEEIIGHARSAAPDLVVHTGDLFDSARPGYEDLHRGVDALRRLADIAPVVVLRGNHDSTALFGLLNKLLGATGRLRFVDRARRPEDGGVLDFESGRGQRIRLASLPFVHANRMVDAFEDPKTWTGAYAARIRDILRALGRGLKDGVDLRRDVLVFAAHLHVAGALYAGSERKVHVADDYASQAEHLPVVSYAAFGHIHKPQELPSSVTGAYAGSPLQLDFGEAGEAKSIVVVEAEPGRPARVERVPLTRGRELREFSGTLEELAERAGALEGSLCKLIIDTEEPEPDLSARVRELLPGAEAVQIIERCAARQVRAVDELDEDERAAGREATPAELFGQYLAEVGTQRAAADRVLDVFRTALAAIEAEARPVFEEESVFAGEAPRDQAAADAGAGDAREDAKEGA